MAVRTTPTPRFRGQVLRQIYRVWLFRRLAPVVIAEIIALVLLFYQLTRAVFVQRVVENGLNVFFARPAGLVPFFVSAFANTRPLTRLLAIGALAALALLVRHLTQGILRFILVRQNYFATLKT